MGRRREVKVLPEALVAWREAAGRAATGEPWSQKELALRAGVSPTLIALIETGERQPSRLNAEEIAKALGVPLGAIAFVYPDELVEAVPA